MKNGNGCNTEGLFLNLEKKRWEETPTDEKKITEEIIQPPVSISEKVKGLFSWFGGSGSKEECIMKKELTPTNMIRPRNLTFHQGKSYNVLPLKEISQNDMYPQSKDRELFK